MCIFLMHQKPGHYPADSAGKLTKKQNEIWKPCAGLHCSHLNSTLPVAPSCPCCCFCWGPANSGDAYFQFTRTTRVTLAGSYLSSLGLITILVPVQSATHVSLITATPLRWAHFHRLCVFSWLLSIFLFPLTPIKQYIFGTSISWDFSDSSQVSGAGRWTTLTP